MKAETSEDVHKTSYAKFQSALAQDMMKFVSSRSRQQPQTREQDTHLPSCNPCRFMVPPCSMSYPKYVRCLVCRLEEDLRLHKRRRGGPVKLGQQSRGSKHKHQLGYCTSCNGAYLHGTPCPQNLVNDMPLFSLPDFRGKTCFEIFHLERCKGLWYLHKRFTTNGSGQREYSRTETWNRNQSHEVYKELYRLYDIPCQKKGRRKKSAEVDDANNYDDNEEEEKQNEEDNDSSTKET